MQDAACAARGASARPLAPQSMNFSWGDERMKNAMESNEGKRGSAHDPEWMDFLLSEGDWDIFGFLPTHGCHECMAPLGKLFLLCRHRGAGHTLVTPCVQHGSRFELLTPSGSFHLFNHIEDLFHAAGRLLDEPLPSRATLISSTRWFVDNPEAEARKALFMERTRSAVEEPSQSRATA